MSVCIAIGGISIRVECTDVRFLHELRLHYAGYLAPGDGADSLVLLVEPSSPPLQSPDADLEVRLAGGIWVIKRGDFHAEWEPGCGRGVARLVPNRYSLDSILRIIHSLELARTGQGLLLHAASAVRDGRAFLFCGPSGAGKTTMSRLAPAGVRLLTDEISYLRRAPNGTGFDAWGTPFAGELARPGENIVAPLSSLYFLRQAGENRIDPLAAPEALRLVLKNTLFFAHDSALVPRVLELAHSLCGSVEVAQLSFAPDVRVWNLIR